MSTESNVKRISRNAGADLSAKKFYAVKISGNDVVLCSVAGENVIGILDNKPTQNQVASVSFDGCPQAIAGGTIAAGDPLKTDAAGKMVTAALAVTNTSDAGSATDPLIASTVFARAMEAAVAGDIFQIMITREGAVPTTAA